MQANLLSTYISLGFGGKYERKPDLQKVCEMYIFRGTCVYMNKCILEVITLGVFQNSHLFCASVHLHNAMSETFKNLPRPEREYARILCIHNVYGRPPGSPGDRPAAARPRGSSLAKTSRLSGSCLKGPPSVKVSSSKQMARRRSVLVCS